MRTISTIGVPCYVKVKARAVLDAMRMLAAAAGLQDAGPPSEFEFFSTVSPHPHITSHSHVFTHYVWYYLCRTTAVHTVDQLVAISWLRFLVETLALALSRDRASGAQALGP